MTATAFHLLSDRWSSMKVVAPSAGYTAGQLVKIRDTVCIIVEDAASGAYAVAVITAEKVKVPKSVTSGQSILAAGDKVYFDAGEAKVCSDAFGNTLCGRALEAAGASDTTCIIQFDGMAS